MTRSPQSGQAMARAGEVFYKYVKFICTELVGAVSPDLKATLLQCSAVASVTAPLAISFLVFEFVHYLMDVARGFALSHLPNHGLALTWSLDGLKAPSCSTELRGFRAMDCRDRYRPVAGRVPGRPIQVPVASADMDEGHVIDASNLIGVLTSFSKEEQSRRVELRRPGLKQV